MDKKLKSGQLLNLIWLFKVCQVRDIRRRELGALIKKARQMIYKRRWRWPWRKKR